MTETKKLSKNYERLKRGGGSWANIYLSVLLLSKEFWATTKNELANSYVKISKTNTYIVAFRHWQKMYEIGADTERWQLSLGLILHQEKFEDSFLFWRKLPVFLICLEICLVCTPQEHKEKCLFSREHRSWEIINLIIFCP